jgi:hypothetical protein
MDVRSDGEVTCAFSTSIFFLPATIDRTHPTTFDALHWGRRLERNSSRG